jgi:hypothetical protein
MDRGADPAGLTDADLLAGRLGDIGADAGAIGAAAAGAPRGAAGGRAGARLAARLLRSRHHEADYVADAPISETAAVLSGAFAQLGTAVDGRSEPGGGHVRGLVGAGVRNLNPAVVRATLAPRPGGGCDVHLTATAKEGLIGQDTARKAIGRLAHAAGLHPV